MSYRIGSAPECDIVFNSPRVSRLHAEIAVLNSGDILLKDKNSTNGTFVNNHPIQPGQWVNIRRGDLVRFADTELQWASVPQIDNSMFKKIFGIGKNAHYNEIVVKGNTVSDFHATLKIDKNGHAFIEDHSLNGTKVNGSQIVSHQNIRIKRNDDVVVGGVPVNLKKYIPADPWEVIWKVVGSAAAVAAIVALVVMVRTKPVVNNGGDVVDKGEVVEEGGNSIDTINNTNPPIEALWEATVYVYGAFYVDVTIKNDPFKNRSSWPKTWTFGYTRYGWELFEENPCWYSGTAFFISPYGELATNRHVAYPWLSDIKEDEIESAEIKAKMIAFINLLLEGGFFENNYGINPNDPDDRAKLQLLLQSDFEISGHHDFLGVLLPHQTYHDKDDFMKCKSIAESGDPNKDVAILRLHSQQTPPEIVKKGYYRLENARVDQSKLKWSEALISIGYPGGKWLSEFIGNANEMIPTYTNLTVSKKPDDNQFQAQGLSLGGASGSPVFDEDRNLVGVLWGGAVASENIVFVCNIKHLCELYEKHKVIR